MLVALLLLVLHPIWSAKVEDFNLSGYHQSVYLVYKEGLLEHFFISSSTLYETFLCSYGFRKIYRPDSNNLDFDELAKSYTNCYLRALIFEFPEKIELYGDEDKTRRAKLTDLKINLKMDDLKFSKKDPISKKVKLSLRNVIENSRSETDASMKVEHKVDKITTTSSTTTHSWKHERSLEVGVKVPNTEIGASVKMSMFASGTSGSSNSDSDSVTYTVTDTYTVPARKTGRLIWTQSESNIQMVWSAYIEATGWIAANVSNAIYFLPVSDMAYVFQEYVTRLGVNTIGVSVSGTLKMNDAVISDAVVDEYDQSDKDIKCPDELTNFTLPKSLIHL